MGSMLKGRERIPTALYTHAHASTHTDFKNKFMVTKGERWGGINQKFGINTHILLYIK